MKRGEIYYADLDPAVGGETKKIRPVLIISNNANNNVANTKRSSVSIYNFIRLAEVQV